MRLCVISKPFTLCSRNDPPEPTLVFIIIVMSYRIVRRFTSLKCVQPKLEVYVRQLVKLCSVCSQLQQMFFTKIRKHNYIFASSLSDSFQHVSQDVMTSSRTYNMTSDRRGKSKLPVVKKNNVLALIVFILDQFEQDHIDSVPHRHFGAILWHRCPFFHPTSCDMMTSFRTYNAIRQKMKV